MNLKDLPEYFRYRAILPDSIGDVQFYQQFNAIATSLEDFAGDLYDLIGILDENIVIRVATVGESGTGKSSLLNSLATLVSDNVCTTLPVGSDNVSVTKKIENKRLDDLRTESTRGLRIPLHLVNTVGYNGERQTRFLNVELPAILHGLIPREGLSMGDTRSLAELQDSSKKKSPSAAAHMSPYVV